MPKYSEKHTTTHNLADDNLPSSNVHWPFGPIPALCCERHALRYAKIEQICRKPHSLTLAIVAQCSRHLYSMVVRDVSPLSPMLLLFLVVVLILLLLFAAAAAFDAVWTRQSKIHSCSTVAIYIKTTFSWQYDDVHGRTFKLL